MLEVRLGCTYAPRCLRSDGGGWMTQRNADHLGIVQNRSRIRQLTARVSQEGVDSYRGGVNVECCQPKLTAVGRVAALAA